ncbi:MAG: hypothetical protein MUF42_07015 [Cytophagaceae bacterium]|jgi:mono/diheme cytochrome c family protein|nr:hypothetical protein [Cytophagaceae bacterium]
MYKKIRLLFLLATSGLLLSACYYNNEEELYGSKVLCDTSDSSYSQSVLPILQQRCLSCHGASTFATMTNGTNLDGYNEIKVQVDNGLLLKVINHQAGATPMPYNGTKLSDCEIKKITNWINAGAKNN